MKIVLAGSNGLIGRQLASNLSNLGHSVVRVRHSAEASGNPSNLTWNPESWNLDLSQIGQVDAVINLAGEPVGSGRWTSETKRKIQDSRINGNRAIVKEIRKMEIPPRVFINGSAIGFYGNRGSELLDEKSSMGEGFLAEVCQKNEAAANDADSTETRVINLRTGVVLSTKGGALARQLPIFKLGLGGKLASGDQYLSWIHLRDEVEAIIFLLNSDIAGPVNLTSPSPCTNAEFTKALGKATKRPTLLSVPKIALSLALGAGVTDEMITAGQRVRPEVLLSSGFKFAFPDISGALESLVREGD